MSVIKDPMKHPVVSLARVFAHDSQGFAGFEDSGAIEVFAESGITLAEGKALIQYLTVVAFPLIEGAEKAAAIMGFPFGEARAFPEPGRLVVGVNSSKYVSEEDLIEDEYGPKTVDVPEGRLVLVEDLVAEDGTDFPDDIEGPEITE